MTTELDAFIDSLDSKSRYLLAKVVIRHLLKNGSSDRLTIEQIKELIKKEAKAS